MFEQLGEWRSFAMAIAILLVAMLIGLVLYFLCWRIVRRLARHTSSVLDDSLLAHCRPPTIALFPLSATYLAKPLLAAQLGDAATARVTAVLEVLLTLGGAWLLIRLLSVIEDVVAERFDVSASDNLRARAVHTQFRIIRRIAAVAIGLLSVAILLAGSEEFRELGTGILASAGLLGLVVGFAAQKTLGNLLAGIQIAITQPIRLDDVVIVEGEWGWIEEITLTYVVVRVWDLRRVVLPIGYFLEKPFQNWTRVSADILGTVYLYLDYTAPIEAIRSELRRIVEQSPLWDGNVCGVQVTDASAQTLEVRALVSALDSGKAWDLRCEVREQLIAFLQVNHPECLPRVRALVEGSVEDSDPSTDA
jgi:small-conductance mechanosensitive channel